MLTIFQAEALAEVERKELSTTKKFVLEARKIGGTFVLDYYNIERIYVFRKYSMPFLLKCIWS